MGNIVTAAEHLVVHAWGAMVTASGTTTFGLLLWTAGVALAVWIAAVVYEWIAIVSGPRTIRMALGKSRPIAVSGVAVFLLIAFVWGVFVVRTIYYERTGIRWAYTQQVQRNKDLASALREKNRGITSDDRAYMGLVQILREFQSYGASVQGKPCTIIFTSDPDSLRFAQAVAETSALVSKCNTFGPDDPELPDSISNKDEGKVSATIVVHAARENHAAILFQRRLGNLLPTRYSYLPPKNPSFAMTENVMWLQFGNGVGWRE
jgi:hypothetical protein